MKRTLLIHPDMPELDREHGFSNINGPSLVRVPEWVENPLGKYYLYFAHHRGAYIRLAYADALKDRILFIVRVYCIVTILYFERATTSLHPMYI